jgi:hypothetical protein
LAPQHTGHGRDRLAVTSGQERSAFTAAVVIGVVPFVVAVFAIRAGGGLERDAQQGVAIPWLRAPDSNRDPLQALS